MTLHYITHHYTSLHDNLFLFLFFVFVFVLVLVLVLFSHTDLTLFAREKKFFSKLLTAGEKLVKLEMSIQDFLLLGPVRLLPLGDRAFSFRSCIVPAYSSAEYSALPSAFVFCAL